MNSPKDYLEEPDLLEQLAEEASELSHAAIKLARHKRGKNPTGRSELELVRNLTE